MDQDHATRYVRRPIHTERIRSRSNAARRVSHPRGWPADDFAGSFQDVKGFSSAGLGAVCGVLDGNRPDFCGDDLLHIDDRTMEPRVCIAPAVMRRPNRELEPHPGQGESEIFIGWEDLTNPFGVGFAYLTATLICLGWSGLAQMRVAMGFGRPSFSKNLDTNDASNRHRLLATSASRSRRYGHMFVIACEYLLNTSS